MAGKAKPAKPAKPKIRRAPTRSGRIAKPKPAPVAPGLPDGVDYWEWLEERGLSRLPDDDVVFYAVAYSPGEEGRPPNDPSEVVESCPAFLSVDDATIAAHELSRGNMSRVVLRCEVVARSPAHDD